MRRHVSTRDVIARSEATKQSRLSSWPWIASLALAMTGGALSSPLPPAGSRRAKLALRGRGWGSTRGPPPWLPPTPTLPRRKSGLPDLREIKMRNRGRPRLRGEGAHRRCCNTHDDNTHPSSWPGLSRPSTSFPTSGSQDVDARDERGHDES